MNLFSKTYWSVIALYVSHYNNEICSRMRMLTFSRNMSVRSGIDSSFGGSRPPGIWNGSLLGAESLAMSLPIGVNSTAMRAFGPCLPSYTGHVSTVSAVVRAAGIAKKSFDGSVVYITLDCLGRSGLLNWSWPLLTPLAPGIDSQM